MWETTVEGRTLNFHLAGINNQNFIMRDDETGSWWQQVTGECILGPLKGRRLKSFDHDELTFATWKAEGPGGRVLRPDPKAEAKGQYAPSDWEQSVGRMRVATTLSNPNETLDARTLVVGVEAGGKAKAYPFTALEKQNPIADTLGGVPLLVLLGEDGKSVRAFDRRLDGRTLELFLKPNTHTLLDTQTGSEWDFTGAAVAGELKGKRLGRLRPLKDYWFDWRLYHPDTSVYLIGEL